MLFANKDSLNFFLSNLDVFYFFCLTCCFGWNFRTMLNKSAKSSHPCLVPHLRGEAFNFLLLSMMLAVDLPYMSFIVLKEIPSVSDLPRIFIIKGC